MPERLSNRKFKSPEEVQAAIDKGYKVFQCCDFSNLNLTNVSLDKLTFDIGCKFNHTKISSACRTKFYSCDLSHADMRGADFRWAKAHDCKAEGIDIRGMQETRDCDLWPGLSVREMDGWGLVMSGTLANSPIREQVRSLIPSKYKLFIDTLFSNY